jgi:hypothetical protein
VNAALPISASAGTGSSMLTGSLSGSAVTTAASARAMT